MADIDADDAGDAGDAGDNTGDAGDAGDVVPQVGPILWKTWKTQCCFKVFGGRERGKYGNLLSRQASTVADSIRVWGWAWVMFERGLVCIIKTKKPLSTQKSTVFLEGIGGI